MFIRFMCHKRNKKEKKINYDFKMLEMCFFFVVN